MKVISRHSTENTAFCTEFLSGEFYNWLKVKMNFLFTGLSDSSLVSAKCPQATGLPTTYHLHFKQGAISDQIIIYSNQTEQFFAFPQC